MSRLAHSIPRTVLASTRLAACTVVFGLTVFFAPILWSGTIYAYHPHSPNPDEELTAAAILDIQYNLDWAEDKFCTAPDYTNHVWSSEFSVGPGQPIAPGQPVRAAHINELRSMVRHIYSSKCYASIPGNSVFGPDAVAGVTVIRAQDVADLVTAMNQVVAAQCISSCTGSLCANGVLDAGETCDDGNLTDGDGCSSTCQCEYVWTDAGGCGSGPCLPTQKPQSGSSLSAQCAPISQCISCVCVNSGSCKADADCCSHVCYSDGVCEPSGGECGPAPHYLMSGGSCKPSCGHLGAITGRIGACCTAEGCRTSSLGATHDCGGGAWCCDATGLPEAVHACVGCGNKICDMNAPDNDGCGCPDCSADLACASCTDPSAQCTSWVDHICGGPPPTAPGHWSEKCNDGGPCDGAIRASSSVCCSDECSSDTECGSDAALCETTSECASPSGGRIFVGHCNADPTVGCAVCSTTVCQQACP